MMTRPLLGEPLAVDLLNTRWRSAGDDVDLLATDDGFAQWLGEAGQTDLAPTESARLAALAARDAIHDLLTAGGRAGAAGAATDSPARDAGAGGHGGVRPSRAEAAVNGILARGLTVRSIEDGRVVEHAVMTGAEWTAAWRAVANFLDLTSQAPDGIRRCAHPDCVLYFFDPTGRRRWCSMAGCGNRAKAKRHYDRRVVDAGRSAADVAEQAAR